MITQSELKELLHYNPETGVFTWLKSPTGRVKIGQIAGAFSSSKYRQIRINGRRYLAHRIAWFWVTGEWPKDMIDHINGIKDANWWLNLREANNSENIRNSGLYSTNTSGVKGVSWLKKSKRWQATIGLNGKNKNLGLFINFEDAVKMRVSTEIKLFGEFYKPNNLLRTDLNVNPCAP